MSQAESHSSCPTNTGALTSVSNRPRAGPSSSQRPIVSASGRLGAPGPVPTSPANRDYAAGFAMALMLKDMNLSQSAAAAVSASTPFAASAAALYQKAVDSGYAAKDFSYIYKIVSGQAPLQKAEDHG